jgi:MFS family permease
MATGGIPPYIYGDIGGTDRWIWFVLAYLISLAGVCPFVGSLSDLMGRRYVALFGSTLILIGVIVSSTAKSMNPFIGKSHIFAPPSLAISFLFIFDPNLSHVTGLFAFISRSRHHMSLKAQLPPPTFELHNLARIIVLT